MPEFIYVFSRARKAHGDKVILDDVTLSFLPGAKIGVVGPNGAGKSTVLKIMAGLEQPSNGEARLTPGYSVGILMQEPKLDETKTVLGNVEEGVGDIKKALDRYNEISELMSDPDPARSAWKRAMVASMSGRWIRPLGLWRPARQDTNGWKRSRLTW